MRLQDLTRESVTTKPARDLAVGDLIRSSFGPGRVLSLYVDEKAVGSGVSYTRAQIETGGGPTYYFVGWLSHEMVDVLGPGANGTGFEPLFATVFAVTSGEPGAPMYDVQARWSGPTRLVIALPEAAAECHRQEVRRELQAEARSLLNDAGDPR